MLCSVLGPQLAFFSRDAVPSAASKRDFQCSVVVRAFQVSMLQSADAIEDDAQTLTGRASFGQTHQRLVAYIHIDGYPQRLRFRLFPFVAPLACENFKLLCADDVKFYDGLLFHRVIQDFMIQGGCPEGDGTGGRVMLPTGDQPFEDELISSRTRDPSGEISPSMWESIGNMSVPYLLCMANAGPNTNQSQFFITTSATPWLKGKHTIFGILSPTNDDEVAAMRATLHQLEAVTVDRESRPVKPLTIECIRVVEDE
jgi:cyclophilin family peptidyl-prolyl cis-trans isomerase